MAKHTPAPWFAGEFGEHSGYDCMTGGIRVGPALLDGADYGQHRCCPISAEALEQMTGDARLIAAAPDLLEAADAAANVLFLLHDEVAALGHRADNVAGKLRAAIAKATGQQLDPLDRAIGQRR